MNIDNIEFESFEFGEVQWTKDCQGKQDFDFPVVYVSTRYYPDHTAKPSIYLGDKLIAGLPDGECITGETETECKYKAEEWIRREVSKIMQKLAIN